MKKMIVFMMILAGAVFAKSAEVDDSSKVQAKALMDNVYESFLKVVTYVYSDEDSLELLKKDEKKKEELVKNLDDLALFFKNARHVEYFQRPGFRPSLESMNYHLYDTINSVKSNNLAFAQKRLSALTSLCISCHSQLSSKGSQNAFGQGIGKSGRSDFTSDYDYGNYLYLIRHFDESEKYLTMSIEKSIEDSKFNNLYSALRRIISMHTKITFDYKKAEDFINLYKDNKKMPTLGKELLASWGKSLLEWKNFNPSKMDSVDKFIKTHLSPLEQMKEQVGKGDNDITLLISSGVLSKYLNDHPKSKDAPQILYWLSVAEKRLSNTYFFTLSDLYLKDCIKMYNKSPYAKKCYALYEENIEFGYTGSSGTDIPAEERTELARLKSYLKK